MEGVFLSIHMHRVAGIVSSLHHIEHSNLNQYVNGMGSGSFSVHTFCHNCQKQWLSFPFVILLILIMLP